MKNKIVCIKSILMVCILVIFAIGVGTVSASAEVPASLEELNIEYANLSFENEVHLMYAIKSDNQNVKLLVFTSEQNEYIYGEEAEALAPISEKREIEGQLYTIFKYTGLAAKQMTDNIYVRAYIPETGEYGETFKYSILQYAYNKLGKTGIASTDEKLLGMLASMLEYGAATQKYFDYKTDNLANSDFVQLKLKNNGTLPDGFSYGLYKIGNTVTITAPQQDTNGLIFDKWIDASGNTVATEATATINIGETNIEYTAVYKMPTTIGLSYTLKDGSYYSVSIGTATDAEIIIPSTYNGLFVKEIETSGFKNCTGIKKVTIPNSVTKISNGAFHGCTNLEKVNFEANSQLDSIGYSSFNNCPNLKSIDIPHTVTSIGTYAFQDCTGLASIIIPISVTSISTGAFRNCTNLTIYAEAQSKPSGWSSTWYGSCYVIWGYHS